MWSNALCTLGVTKPLCNCLSIRQVAAAAAAAAAGNPGPAITTGPTASNNTSRDSLGKRPFKVWDGSRTVRKGIVAPSFADLTRLGKIKLGVPPSEHVSIVLDGDGTQVDDGEYFNTLPPNSVLIFLRKGEIWTPSQITLKDPGAILEAVAAIPKIVCETICALELQHEVPSWKIMDNKGRVTVVLHWDQRMATGGGGGGGTSSSGSMRASGSTGPSTSDKYSPPSKKVLTQSSVDTKSSQSSVSSQTRYTTNPQITVAGKDGSKSLYHPGGVMLPGSMDMPGPGRMLPKQAGSFESALSSVHVHSEQCTHIVETRSRAGSPISTVCDFHCCALHEEGRPIAANSRGSTTKNTATSPIQEGAGSPQPLQLPTSSTEAPIKRSAGKGHVRFLDVGPERESSESETDNTVIEDDKRMTEKFLLLIDQLSVDQKRHLNIKDIGIILDRLSTKIVDVDRLERETESADCYNWTIKATIRGDAMRELGVIYNGNYYAICEHPGYKQENEEMGEEMEMGEEEEEEDDDDEVRI